MNAWLVRSPLIMKEVSSLKQQARRTQTFHCSENIRSEQGEGSLMLMVGEKLRWQNSARPLLRFRSGCCEHGECCWLIIGCKECFTEPPSRPKLGKWVELWLQTLRLCYCWDHSGPLLEMRWFYWLMVQPTSVLESVSGFATCNFSNKLSAVSQQSLNGKGSGLLNAGRCSKWTKEH